MQVQPINFQGNHPRHGAKSVEEVLNRLYARARKDIPELTDTIKISTKLKNGLEVTGTAQFDKGHLIDIIFPDQQAIYRKEFCSTILEKFNKAITKGKIGH